ncbi:MAG: bacillithiol biosynthesis cysteine-adding enzyme BshC [Acidobacteria bacterium]|nr:bacillithiol biosynthesis cysteine-adding enzyme BshC [Acidobacteriota bacterium]
MDCHCIPYTHFPNATRLFVDCLYNFAQVREFYSYNPFDGESFRRAAEKIPQDQEFRRQVVGVLREQNRRFGAREHTFENLTKLQDPNCVAVVTGHQVGLFSGPAFAFYKNLSAIKLARSLTQSGLRAVPVIWLATEDHDFEEVNHCFVQDRDGTPHRLSYAGQPPVPNAASGSVPITDAILPLLDELHTLMPESPSATELLEHLAETYRPGKAFGEAFAGFMMRLFSEYGVILLDPLDSRLHRLSSSAFRAAIESAPVLTNALLERNRRLTESGYHAQVHVGDDFSLLFVYVNGERRALRMRGGRFVTAQGDTYSTDELLAQLERAPETISANVLLRPIMQDTLLPTVAYVGGPSEMAYFAQAAAVYERVLGRMPVVFPRASLTMLDPAASRLFGKYGISLPDVFAGKQPLRDKMASRFLPPGLTELFKETAANLEADLQRIQEALSTFDPTLVDAAETSGRKMHHQLTTLEHKAAAAVQKRSEQIERDATRLENALYPKKAPQERIYSGINFLARHGAGFMRELYEQIPLHSAQHQVLGF